MVAHFHYVLFGGSIFGLTAGAYYWWPKMFGRMLSESLGKVHFWLMLIGFNLTFFPMHFVGLHGMPRRVYTYPAELGFETLNQIETAGSFVLGLAFVVFLVNIFQTWRKPANAPADPWNGATLEGTFPHRPSSSTSRKFRWFMDATRAVEAKRERRGTLPEPVRVSGKGIHMPNPSYWPAVAALGVLAVFLSLMLFRRTPACGGWLLRPHSSSWECTRGPSSRRGEDRSITAVAHDVPHGLEHATSTGLDNRKLAIWTFIGSECRFFASLISNYLVHKGRSLVGPYPHSHGPRPAASTSSRFEIPLVTLGTALLLFSPLFVVLALSGAQRGSRKALVGWLALRSRAGSSSWGCRRTSPPISCTGASVSRPISSARASTR